MLMAKSFRLMTPLGELNWNGKDKKQYASFAIEKETGLLTIRLHDIGEEFPSKPFLMVYSPFMIEYGETLEISG